MVFITVCAPISFRRPITAECQSTFGLAMGSLPLIVHSQSHSGSSAYKSPAKCQSCGLKLVEDKQGGGSNSDGTRSRIYCSSCYQNGRFVQPHLSLAEMRRRECERLKSL